jgi:hypothetical protein
MVSLRTVSSSSLIGAGLVWSPVEVCKSMKIARSHSKQYGPFTKIRKEGSGQYVIYIKEGDHEAHTYD